MRCLKYLILASFFCAAAAHADVDLGFDTPSDYWVAPGNSQISITGSAASLTQNSTYAGDAHMGPLTVNSPNSVINVAQALGLGVAPGALQIEVENGADFAAGMAVLLLQSTATGLGVSGAQAALLNLGGAGAFEWVRLASVDGNTLTLQTPLQNAYNATPATQVVSLPEYTTATINAPGTLVPPQAWDGSKGGVVALAAASGLQLSGAIMADGMGFAGGVANTQADNTCHATWLDDPLTPPHSGGKGEGAAGMGQAGRGNLANGAGGGNSLQAGGGGGGGGGAGGEGGYESLTCGEVDRVGGLPGVSITPSPAQLVCLGGGGGGGQQDGAGAAAGGAGGGAVFVFATGILGSDSGAAAGVISARGAPGGAAGNQGGGGGGAGGSVYLLTANAPLGGLTVDASGGVGGAVAGTPLTGPGGGGGGGRIFISGGWTRPPVVDRGGPGTDPNANTNLARWGTFGVAEAGGYVQLAAAQTQETCLARLIETLDPNSVGGALRYVMSRDGGANWEYWAGGGWATGATRANAQDPATLSAHLRSFRPITQLNLRLYFNGDATAQLSVDDVLLKSCACGDGAVDPGEACDDGNQQSGDGCDATCQLESGFSCAPGLCARTCGNSTLNSTEACDDGNLTAGDGCAPACQVESGWVCHGSPSLCAKTCGDGILDSTEKCDDGNGAAGDGCSSCRIDAHWYCVGAPSLCHPLCGDGAVDDDIETCDDGNAQPRDGCSPTCVIEPGWSCAPTCQHMCGDGLMNKTYESCDDGNVVDGDGCAASCRQEVGWVCAGAPSHCTLSCGNGRIDFREECDDGNRSDGDGCSANCMVEPTFTCASVPSVCEGVCGDGKVVAGEQCDDGNLTDGDGCTDTCTVELTYICYNSPSVCVQSCGNNVVDLGEACDQGLQNGSGIGCNTRCYVDTGWYCVSSPSLCNPICGDGFLAGGEQCDDGNAQPNDGCSSTCRTEVGWTCDRAQPEKCTPVCGDGLVLGPEACDSGLVSGSLGCSATCAVTQGYVCHGQPSTCTLLPTSTTGTPGATGTPTGTGTGTTTTGGGTTTTTTGGASSTGGSSSSTTGATREFLQGQLGGAGCSCRANSDLGADAVMWFAALGSVFMRRRKARLLALDCTAQ